MELVNERVKRGAKGRDDDDSYIWSVGGRKKYSRGLLMYGGNAFIDQVNTKSAFINQFNI